MPVLYALDWRERRRKFVSGYTFNRMLESFMRRIERQMDDCQDKKSGRICIFSEETSFTKAQYSELCCICVVNGQTGDFSPAAFYFPGDILKISAAGLRRICDNLRQELGW